MSIDSTLALHQTTDVTVRTGFLHFGLAMPTVAALETLCAEMESNHISVNEKSDEPNLVSFKCLDPDGWRVEVYWEVP